MAVMVVDSSALAAAFARRKEFGVNLLDVDHDEVLGLAKAAQLTAYDADYLWLARSKEAALITLDKQLVRAASH